MTNSEMQPTNGAAAATLLSVGLGGLVLGIAALGKCIANSYGADTDQKSEAANGEVAQNRTSQLKHTSTHKFPDFVTNQPDPAGFDAVQIGPQYGGDSSGFP